MMLIDTHAHLDFGEYIEDQPDVIRRAVAAGVKKIITVGCDAGHFLSSLELARENPEIYAAIGYHPHEAVSMMSHDSTVIEKNIREAMALLEERVRSTKLVAIGEIGLDYYRLAPVGHQDHITVKNVQTMLFAEQCNLAVKNGLPVIIHCREAYDDVFSVLSSLPKERIRGVIHCFEGGWADAQKFLSLGFKISFTGNLTYERASDTIEAARLIPAADLMVETDCPYLTPVPLRGQRNEPAYVEYVCRRLAEIREVTPEEMADQTTRNAVDFFKLT
ncbi:MAG: TatD family hydrolase [Patescibacteria group bacterium]